jgi:hypothetical protein
MIEQVRSLSSGASACLLIWVLMLRQVRIQMMAQVRLLF